jgi:hypothetical protein
MRGVQNPCGDWEGRLRGWLHGFSNTHDRLQRSLAGQQTARSPGLGSFFFSIIKSAYEFEMSEI